MNKENIKINKALAKKVISIVDKGLVKGLGEAEAGKMCIEAAVCFALGLPHGDNPPCVGGSVRDFKISLNDTDWPTNKDRTEGMRRLAIAQLGSNEIDQEEFLKVLGFNCMTRVLPVLVENALEVDKDNELVKNNVKIDDLELALKKLKSAKDFDEAKSATRKIRDIYSASASAYASAYLKKNPKFLLRVLNLVAECGLDALKELKSPGCKWLNLCN